MRLEQYGEREGRNVLLHIHYPPTEDCKNPDSYGMICVKCNECGRFTLIKDEPEVQEKK